MQPDETLAFLADDVTAERVEVRVNFGLHAGRDVTNAEIDALARALYPLLHGFAIVSLRRHELEHGREAVVHQVKLEADPAAARDGVDTDGLAERLLALTTGWARDCIEQRSVEIAGA